MGLLFTFSLSIVTDFFWAKMHIYDELNANKITLAGLSNNKNIINKMIIILIIIITIIIMI